MEKMNRYELTKVLQDVAASGTPIMGICLGLQLFFERSDESEHDVKGLSLLPGEIVRFPEKEGYKIPHMGWDVVEFKQDHPLVKNLTGQQRFYFVHSYHAKCDSAENVLMACDYGYEFAASVCKDNVMGVQFHPEKSHDFGMALLKNFVEEC